MLKLLHNRFTIYAVVMTTLVGIAIHDTKIDTVASLLAIPAALMLFESGTALLSSDAHTHQEKVSIDRAAIRYTSLMPRTKAKHDDDGKFRMTKKVSKGHHGFDSYNMPLDSATA